MKKRLISPVLLSAREIFYYSLTKFRRLSTVRVLRLPWPPRGIRVMDGPSRVRPPVTSTNRVRPDSGARSRTYAFRVLLQFDNKTNKHENTAIYTYVHVRVRRRNDDGRCRVLIAVVRRAVACNDINETHSNG